MPPPHIHKPLSPDEKRLLRQWIQQGAPYEDHWAYTPMRASLNDRSLTDSIDALIESQFDSADIRPVELADRITLIRRLSFDLTGLPPTSEEVDQFLSDDSPTAYEALVDRLLSSARYGERMAVYWLDLVRYADTVGYHGDQNVSQSPYRDYVIEAFNRNMPYDQFVREQLAGDLLPDPSIDQLVASGYNRLNQTTEEGGSQAKEYLAIYFADRVRNVSQVFLGATIGCAQCHDHKYDPYTTRDFYSLGAFFADLDERGVYGARNRPPMIHVPSDDQQKQLDDADLQIASKKTEKTELRQELLTRQSAWEQIAITKIDTPEVIETVFLDDEEGMGGNRVGTFEFGTENESFPIKSGTQSRRQASDGLVQHYFDKSNQAYSVGEETVFFSWVYLDPDDPPHAIMLQFNDGNWEHRKVWGSDEIIFGRRKESYAGFRRAGQLPEKGKWIKLEVTANEVGLKTGAKVNGMAFTQFAGRAYWDKAGAVEVKRFPESIQTALRIAAADRSVEQSKNLADYYIAQTPEMTAMDKSLAELQAKRKALLDSITQTVVSKSVKPRTIRVLPRGNWQDDSGEIVQPAIPKFLGKLETGDRRPNRLDLANWICDSNNPLTSRTIVNRIWALLFGRGICSSVDDFGGQGTYPSNPDLLDQIASDFVDSGWDLKGLIKSIVMSKAYQRRSTPTSDLKSRDPYNDRFAYQGRFTLNAEFVRDTALLNSGLLVEQLGGQSVRPYQPVGYYAQLNFPRRTYQADEGMNQYRRGVYTHWQRTFLHPMLKAFDAPSREECTAARARSNTPLQALALLNDPTFVEAACAFAERIIADGGTTTDERLAWAYRQVLSRELNPQIDKALQTVWTEDLQRYQSDAESAKALLSTGQTGKSRIEGKDPATMAELAAWTGVARVLFNLQETITRY